MKKWQQGRTMMETLAVIGIAAIISVAGFAGYLMAMNRYRTDKILDYVNRCAAIAQAHGDGYTIEDSYCGDMLSDEAPNGLDGKEFVVSKGSTGNELTYTVTTPYISSEDIRTALVGRATSQMNGEIIDIWDFQGKIEFTFRR